MFFRVLRKIFQRHLKYHLLIPLFVGLVIEYGTHWLTEHRHGVFWTWLNLLAPLMGILAAYLVVMYFVIRSETDIGLRRIRSTKLEQALKDATGFLGIGAIDLREWFEPSPQVYLATIMERKIVDPNFTYNRVLIFSKAAFKDLDSQYLNGYYAKALIDIHKAHRIGLAYLMPDDLDAIMRTFDLNEGKAIGYYPRWLPAWLLKITPESLLDIWNRSLALAVVEKGNKQRIMTFSIHGVLVDIHEIPDHITDETRIGAYSKLITAIKGKVFEGANIKPEYDFLQFY